MVDSEMVNGIVVNHRQNLTNVIEARLVDTRTFVSNIGRLVDE